MTQSSDYPAAQPALPVIRVQGLTNDAFLRKYACPGCIGLASGLTLIDKAICRAQRHVEAHGRWGLWSHSFVFEGKRIDGEDWLIESDLDAQAKHIRLGAQENRVAKLYDSEVYANLAVLDFGLTPAQTATVLRTGLDLVATHTKYSMRELFGAWLALRDPRLRGKDNPLARDHSYFCSSFVLHLFRSAGVDLLPGLAEKTAAPEDLFRSPLPHTAYLLVRRKVTLATGNAMRRVRVGLKRALRRASASSR